jgi:hypothetical protein
MPISFILINTGILLFAIFATWRSLEQEKRESEESKK